MVDSSWRDAVNTAPNLLLRQGDKSVRRRFKLGAGTGAVALMIKRLALDPAGAHRQ
jgi:hypothetical protein